MKYFNILLFVICFLLIPYISISADEIGEIDVKINPSLTIKELAELNDISIEKFLKGMNLEESDGEKTLSQTGKSLEEAELILRKLKVLGETDESKNWKKILSKFILWTLALIVSTLLLMKKKVSKKIRIIWMIGVFVIFGFIYGSDPNPMGTVKDAIVLYGREGVIFPPRVIALLVFLLFVFISNKSICSWGCHLGALQDCLNFIPVKRKFKLPFWVTNSIRILVFISVIVFIFISKYDWIGEVDPFKVFNIFNWQMSFAGVIFLLFILFFSLFFYRPWCQLFCPFGLTGWIVEQMSLLKPQINRDGCVKCKKCITVCPTQAMNDIYHSKKIRADCFGCSNCIIECPVNVIDWRKK